VVKVLDVPRSKSVITTLAETTAAPLWSVTVPRMRPAVDCARTGYTTLSKKTISKKPTITLAAAAGAIVLSNREYM
jgi:hypothetical protein